MLRKQMRKNLHKKIVRKYFSHFSMYVKAYAKRRIKRKKYERVPVFQRRTNKIKEFMLKRRMDIPQIRMARYKHMRKIQRWADALLHRLAEKRLKKQREKALQEKR